jgi:CRP/FNR family transcriptional regulator, cyclic AMP receptor protein
MVTNQEIQDYKLFAGLTENELSEVADLCRRRVYNGNSIIFSPDFPSDDLFIVEGGNDAIQIEVPLGPREGKVVIHTLSKGETFGWAALGPQHIRTATARCLEDVHVICLNGQNLMRLCEDDNHIGYIIMKNLIDIINTRLSYTTIVFRQEIRKLRRTVAV